MKLKKPIKKNHALSGTQKKKSTSIMGHLRDRFNNMGRKMSRGASDIFRIVKERSKWGNKQIFGTRKNRRKSK